MFEVQQKCLHSKYNKMHERRCSMGCIAREGVRRNALRVLCPKSPHFEESAQHIEWRIPTGSPTNFVNWWGVELRVRSLMALG
jgi:hypothetical protein